MTDFAYSVRLVLPDTGDRPFATVSAPDRRSAATTVAARWPLMPLNCLWVVDPTGQSAPETVAGLLGCPDGAPAPETASTGLLAPPAGVVEAERKSPGVVVRLRERELTPGQRKARDRRAQLARSERLRAHYLAKGSLLISKGERSEVERRKAELSGADYLPGRLSRP